MDKMEACGIEVSARELVVVRGEKKEGRVRRFANTGAKRYPLPHIAVLRPHRQFGQQLNRAHLAYSRNAAGLDRREYSSGISVRKHTRISKVGDRHLWHTLYMPALVASRYEPHLRGFYERLLARGKKKQQALVAVARKLLHAIYRMFRCGMSYDGSRVFALPTQTTA